MGSNGTPSNSSFIEEKLVVESKHVRLPHGLRSGQEGPAFGEGSPREVKCLSCARNLYIW